MLKHILAITGIILFLLPTLVQAQFVGIGTTTPTQKLEIYGTGDQFIKVHTTSAGASSTGLDLTRSSEFSGTDWRIVNDGGVLNFYDAINNFTAAGELNMSLTQGGNLGIGVASPLSRLHIAGSTDQFLKVHRTTAGSGMAGIDLLRDTEFSATDWRIANDGGTLKFFDAINNFSGAADVNMTITQGGNIGIGTETPEAALHVIGADPVSETGDGYVQVGAPAGIHLRIDNNEILARNGDNISPLYLQYWSGNLLLCENAAGRVGVGTISPAAKMHVTDGADVSLASGGELVLGPTTGSNIAMDGNEIQARSNGAAGTLFFQSSGGDILLVPNETGQVGIGITSSATLPDDDYMLAVDGRIISEEVRVEVSGSWPDYVFEENYSLTSLPDLEKQIRTLGHLPGIPSAAQIEEDGILLGDMQRMMMEKIEELTLHIIALQKEIEELKNK